MSQEIKVPDIGDFDAVEIIEVLVSAGDTVEAEQALLVLESDKATMEVPCPQPGTLTQVNVKVGDKVAQGDVIASLEPQQSETDNGKPDERGADEEEQQQDQRTESQSTRSETQSSEQRSAPQSSENKKPQPGPAPQPAPADAQRHGKDLPHASPSIRLFARELGVDLTQLEGTGPKGRILREDVQGYVKARLNTSSSSAGALPSMPDVDFSKYGETEITELSRIRKLSAKNLHRNWVVVPHVTQFESADITELEAFRKDESARAEVKLTLLPFVIKAACLALKAYPEFNSSLTPDGTSLILKKYCNIGFAADTPHGLVVPVIRDANRKSVSELALEAGELAKAARDGKLSAAQMQGGCFSISSLGGIGGSHFTPIVNAPEVAILGVSRAKQEAVWDGQAFQPRLMLPLSLSYDHRVIDGAAAARFAVKLSELLSDVRRLCL